MKTTKSILFILFLDMTLIFGQSTGDYRTVDSGNWTQLNVWEYFNGTSWITPSVSPTSSSESITIRSGHTITLPNSTYIILDQVIVESSAELVIPDGTSITVNDGTGDDFVVNGKLSLGGSLHGTGKVIINGTFEWYYSTFSDWSSYAGISNKDINISTSGEMSLTGTSQKWMYAGIIKNSGTITLPDGTGFLHGIENAELHNLSTGVIDIALDGKIYTSGVSGFYNYGFRVYNYGTIKKSAGSGTALLEKLFFFNYGTALIQSGTLDVYSYNNSPGHTGTFTLSMGTTLIFRGNGAQHLADNALINGTGTVQITTGSLNFAGNTTGAIFDTNIDVQLSGGELGGGTNKGTVKGSMNWSGGTISGALTIPEGVELLLTGSATKSLNNSKIYNYGTIKWQDGGFNPTNYGELYNESSGIFEIQCDQTLDQYNYYGYTGRINNYGTINKTTTSGVTTISRGFINNHGSIAATSGDIVLVSNAGINNYGSIEVSEGKLFSMIATGTYLNINSGSILDIIGTLEFRGANITTNNTEIILGGASSQILDESSNNALANFATNSSTGKFTLKNGRNFSTNAATFTNNGILDCGTNIFSGSGNFTNGSGATLKIGSPDGITQSGSSGNIQSSGTRTYSNSANYIYNGTAAQITGSGLPNQVNDLTLDNSNGLTLSASVSVAGTLYLNSGNIFTDINQLVLGTSTSSLGTLNRTTGSIIGTFSRWFAASTVENVVFPVGTATNYRPVNISFTAAPTTGGNIGARFVSSNPGTAGLPLNDGGESIQNIGIQGYWEVFNWNGLAGGTYDMDLTGDGFTGITDYTALHLLRRDDEWSNWDVAGSHAACTGSNGCPTVHRIGLTSFSEFGIGSTSANPLPVELISFDAVILNNQVTLTWKTATEINSYKFEIERAKTQNNKQLTKPIYETIGFIQAAGNSQTVREYSFTDCSVSTGSYIYRLKQIDIDGNFEYSNSINVENNSLPTTFNLFQNYPNPFNPSTTLQFSLPEKAHVSLIIYDILGNKILTIVDDNFEVGTHKKLFNGKNLASGNYVYHLTAQTVSGSTYNIAKMMTLLK